MAATSKNVVLAVDVSGSTGGNKQYWDCVDNVLESFGGSSFGGRIILWDHNAWDDSVAQLKGHICTRKGIGGTSPCSIVAYVCREGQQLGDNIHLVLLTDGEVYGGDIDALDQELARHGSAFAPVQVTCHLIGAHANLSVSCPFTRDVPHNVYHHVTPSQAPEMVMTLSAEDKKELQALEDITTIDAFTDVLPALTRAVTAKTLGTTGCSELKTRVLQLRKRLLADQGVRAAQGSPAVQQLSDALLVDDLATATEVAGRIAAQFYNATNSWSKEVDRLVAMCDGSLRGTLQPSRLQREGTQEAPAAVADTDGEQAGPGMKADAVPFICPVTLDEENDTVLLIRAPDQPLLEAIEDKAVVDALLNCPLAALRRQDLIKAVLAHIDHPVSLPAVKASPKAFRTSPLTRAPLIDSQIPGMCISAHPEHAQATDHALALLLAGGKRPGNMDLWFAVVLLAIESELAPEYLRPLLPALRRHMQWRLKERITAASLTGLADMVTTRLPLGAACWFVMSGAHLPGVKLHNTRDPLRPHIFHSDALCRLVELAGFKLVDGAEQHALRLRALASLLSASKKDVDGLRGRLRALHQASVVVRCGQGDAQDGDGNGVMPNGNGSTTNGGSVTADPRDHADVDVVFIPLDGAASEGQADCARRSLLTMCRMRGTAEGEELSLAELAGLGAMVGPELSMGAISLPGDWAPPAVPQASWEWGGYTQERFETRMKGLPVEICESTCRPFYTPGGQVWREVATEKLGMPVEEMLPLRALYARFVCGKGRYPSEVELLRFVYDRVRLGAWGRSTLPFCAVEIVRDAMRDFEGVRGKLSVDEFAKRFSASASVVRRVEMETSA